MEEKNEAEQGGVIKTPVKINQISPVAKIILIKKTISTIHTFDHSGLKVVLDMKDLKVDKYEHASILLTTDLDQRTNYIVRNLKGTAHTKFMSVAQNCKEKISEPYGNHWNIGYTGAILNL